MSETERFAILMCGDERTIALDEAALVVASYFHEHVDVDARLREFDRLADGCGSSLDAILDRVFGQLGFRGNTIGYYDPDNSFLDSVLDRRLGIPITLSIVLSAIARRAGRHLECIGMPGHFLCRDAESGRYIDSFGGGVLLDEAACRRLFVQLHGDDAPWDQQMLAPIGSRGVIRRMLNNLAQIAIASNDHRSRVIATRLRSVLPDSTTWERTELARAYRASGDFERAACVLEATAAEAPVDEAQGLRYAAAELRALLN